MRGRAGSRRAGTGEAAKRRACMQAGTQAGTQARRQLPPACPLEHSCGSAHALVQAETLHSACCRLQRSMRKICLSTVYSTCTVRLQYPQYKHKAEGCTCIVIILSCSTATAAAAAAAVGPAAGRARRCAGDDISGHGWAGRCGLRQGGGTGRCRSSSRNVAGRAGGCWLARTCHLRWRRRRRCTRT